MNTIIMNKNSNLFFILVLYELYKTPFLLIVEIDQQNVINISKIYNNNIAFFISSLLTIDFNNNYLNIEFAIFQYL